MNIFLKKKRLPQPALEIYGNKQLLCIFPGGLWCSEIKSYHRPTQPGAVGASLALHLRQVSLEILARKKHLTGFNLQPVVSSQSSHSPFNYSLSRCW